MKHTNQTKDHECKNQTKDHEHSVNCQLKLIRFYMEPKPISYDFPNYVRIIC